MIKSNKAKYITISKGLILILLFVLPLCFNVSDVNLSSETVVGDYSTDNKNSDVPIMQNSEDFFPIINGTGNNRTIHVHMRNSSTAEGIDVLNISSQADLEYLYKGAFNFNFTSINFTTEYVIENDTPLKYPMYNADPHGRQLELLSGDLNQGDNQSYTDFDVASYLEIDSDTNAIEFEIVADFNNIPTSVIKYNEILGYSVRLKYEIDKLVDLNISGLNYSDDSWAQFYDGLELKEGVTSTETFYIENKNLNFRDNDDTGNTTIKLNFSNSTEDFNLKLYGAEIKALRAHEIPINNEQKVALEFDTKGICEIHGFSAWIRSFNTTSDETSNLTIRLYHSNSTGELTRSELLDVNALYNSGTPMRPDVLISEFSLLNFSKDELITFNFTDSIDPLNISNYFIEFESNTTSDKLGKSFSLVTIPNEKGNGVASDPNDRIDHLVIANTTEYWKPQAAVTGGTYFVDAAGFSVNITRAFKASELNITINDLTIQNTLIDANIFPRDEGNEYEQSWWGLGKVTENLFDEPLKNENSNFSLELVWGEEVHQESVPFIVNYTVEKYVVDSAYTNYSLEHGKNPNWNVTYTLDFEDYENWEFEDLRFFIPKDWQIKEVIAKNGTNVVDLIEFFFSPNYPNIKDNSEIRLLNSTIIGHPSNGEGNYTIHADSPNYVKSQTTYLKYNEYTYETGGIMPGDNLTSSVSVANYYGEYVSDIGNASIMLYGPDNELIETFISEKAARNSSETYTLFDFDKEVMIESDLDSELGIYKLIATWNDGEEAGIAQRNIFLNNYTGQIYSISQKNDNKQNQILGRVNAFDTDIMPYYMIIYAIEEITGEAATDTFQINHTNVNDNIALDFMLKSYFINQSVLNRGENVTLRFDIQNNNKTLDFDIQIVAELVSSTNTDWILANQSSDIVNLDIKGTPDDSNLFEINLTVPKYEDGGLTGPIRFGPMQMRYKILLDGETMGSYLLNELLYYTNKTSAEFSGRIIESVIYSDRIGNSFIAGFDYQYLELPATNHYFVQAFSDYYIHMNHEESFEIYEKLTGHFDGLETSSHTFNKATQLTVSGTLIDTYSNAIENNQIDIYLRNLTQGNTEDWIAINDISEGFASDYSGAFNGIIDLSALILETSDRIEILLNSTGNSELLDFSETIRLTKEIFVEEIIIELNLNKFVVNYNNIITVSIENLGNSTLNDIEFNIVDSDFDYRILDVISKNSDEYTKESLVSGEKKSYRILFEKSSFTQDTANFTIEVSATSLETNNSVNKSETYTTDVLRINEDLLINILIVIGFVIGVLIIYIYTAKYAINTYKEINKVPEDTKTSKVDSKKGGKYVKVEELKRKDGEGSDSDEDSSSGISLDELID